MITLSLNFNGLIGKTDRASHVKKVREIVDSHLSFPGSDKLKMGLNIKDNGATSVTFAGPQEIVSEAKRLWQEKVQPAANRLKRSVDEASASVKKKAASSVKKASASLKKATASVKRKATKGSVPKRKKVRVTVKAKVTKRKVAKKKK